MKYKIPHIIVKFSYKLAVYWFLVASFIIMFGLGDMGKTLKVKEFFYINKPSGVESARHYETLYLIDRLPKYWHDWKNMKIYLQAYKNSTHKFYIRKKILFIHQLIISKACSQPFLRKSYRFTSLNLRTIFSLFPVLIHFFPSFH